MSRLSSLGLAAAALLVTMLAATSSFAQGAAAAAAPPPITPEAKAAGMKDVPALIQALSLPCTLVDARQIGTGTLADKSTATFYEAACKGGLGFVIIKSARAAPIAYDCLIMAKPGPNGKVGNLVCRLPENAQPWLGLQPAVSQAGRNACVVQNARFIDLTTDQKKLYEVACADGEGLVLEVAVSGTPGPVADNCLAYAGQALACTLTTAAQEIASVDQLAASSGKCATVAKKRYVLSTTDGSDYFEVACSDGKGYMLQASAAGKLAGTIPCADAGQIGNGCTLTDARQAEVQEDALYTQLSKQAGFDCTVSKYALFPQSDASKDIVEEVCSNRPDGAVAIFPAHGAGVIYDCIRSQDEGYKCTFSPESAVYPQLTAGLQSKNMKTCTVSNARPFGRAEDGTDLVEVACADGGPGLVLMFGPGSSKVTEVQSCGQIANVNGGCQLPRAKKS